MKKPTQLTKTLYEEIVVDRIYSVLNNAFHVVFQKINFFNYLFQLDFSSFKKQFIMHDDYRDPFKGLNIINIDENSVRKDH